TASTIVLPFESVIFSIVGPWKINAKIIAKIIPVPKAINGFVLSNIKTITATGTKNSQGVILKVASIVLRIRETSVLPEVSMDILITLKAIKVINKVGTVV